MRRPLRFLLSVFPPFVNLFSEDHRIQTDDFTKRNHWDWHVINKTSEIGKRRHRDFLVLLSSFFMKGSIVNLFSEEIVIRWKNLLRRGIMGLTLGFPWSGEKRRREDPELSSYSFFLRFGLSPTSYRRHKTKTPGRTQEDGKDFQRRWFWVVHPFDTCQFLLCGSCLPVCFWLKNTLLSGESELVRRTSWEPWCWRYSWLFFSVRWFVLQADLLAVNGFLVSEERWQAQWGTTLIFYYYFSLALELKQQWLQEHHEPLLAWWLIQNQMKLDLFCFFSIFFSFLSFFFFLGAIHASPVYDSGGIYLSLPPRVWLCVIVSNMTVNNATSLNITAL